MTSNTLLQIVDGIVTVLWLAIVVRSLLSWFPAAATNPFGRAVFQLTEPIISPIRRIMPRSSMIDLSPLIAIILLYIVRAMLHALIAGM